MRELLPKIVADGSSLDEAIYETLVITREAKRLLFIGNGGSAAIASHMAIDWTKNAEVPAMCFNDAAALTAIGNDIGFNSVFAVQIGCHYADGDVLFAISSSGQSQDIIAAVNLATKGPIITFSGFASDNPLRRKGTINFYVPSNDYGLVECSHLILNHAILNAAIGLKNA